MQTLLATVLFFISTALLPVPAINDGIVSAFETGNAKKLSGYFSSSIDLNVPDNEGVYSKAQAQLILKDFFDKNTPRSFKVLHSGTSKNKSYYSIGNLNTETGKFRTYLLYKKDGDSTIIQELRIETDEEN